MGLIRVLLIACLFVVCAPAKSQDDILTGNGQNAVFYQMEPEFLSLNYDRALSKDGDKWHVRTGFMVNLSLWMGVPLQFTYLIPVGTSRNHLSLGLVGAYTWDSKSVPWEVWGGPAIGYRFQPKTADLFFKAELVSTYNRYWDGSDFDNKFRFRPNFGIGFSF